METIGTRINALRKRDRITQGQLGEFVGLTAAGISSIEKGLSANPETIDAIAKHFKVAKEWLHYGQGEAPKGVVAYKLPVLRRPKPLYLCTAELSKVNAHHFASDRLNHVKDLFLFQCYTGLSYSDLAAFSGDSITNAAELLFLKGCRVKTGEGYFLPWLPEALLFDRWGLYLNFRFIEMRV